MKENEPTPTADSANNWLINLQRGIETQPKRKITRRKLFKLLLAGSLGTLVLSTVEDAVKTEEAYNEAAAKFTPTNPGEIKIAMQLESLSKSPSNSTLVKQSDLNHASALIQQHNAFTEERDRIQSNKVRFWRPAFVASFASSVISFLGYANPSGTSKK